MTIDLNDPELKRVAIELARLRSYAGEAQTKVAEGFSIPTWLLFASQAQEIIDKYRIAQ